MIYIYLKSQLYTVNKHKFKIKPNANEHLTFNLPFGGRIVNALQVFAGSVGWSGEVWQLADIAGDGTPESLVDVKGVVFGPAECACRDVQGKDCNPL